MILLYDQNTIVLGRCLIPWVSCWGDCCTPTLGLLHETAVTERGTPYRWYRQHTYSVHQCPPSASTLYQVCFSLWCQSVVVPLSVRGRENMHISGTTLGQKLYIHLCRSWELWHLSLILIVLWVVKNLATIKDCLSVNGKRCPKTNQSGFLPCAWHQMLLPYPASWVLQWHDAIVCGTPQVPVLRATSISWEWWVYSPCPRTLPGTIYGCVWW